MSDVAERISMIRRGDVPPHYRKTKIGIYPKDWTLTSMGDCICEYREISNNINEIPVYSSSRNGLIPQAEYYDGKEAVQTNIGYKVVPPDYITYRHMSDDDIFHFNMNQTGGNILVSSEYPVFTVSDKAELGFILSVLNNTPRFRYFCGMRKLGGTRTRLYFKNLCAYQFYIPPLAEQKKISEILAQCDKVIELYQREIEELKNLKKGYMKKMFPAKDTSFPEIRFPRFTQPWEQRKLGETCKITMGQSPDGETYSDTPSDYILVQGNADLKDGWVLPRIWTTQKTKTAEAGDIIMSVRAPAGTIGKTAYDVVLGRGVAGIKGNEFIHQTLLKMNFDGYWRKFAAGSTFESINSDAISNAEIMIPDIEEQQLLGKFFNQQDYIIGLYQKKIEEMEQKKESLIQLLLTGIVRVKP